MRMPVGVGGRATSGATRRAARGALAAGVGLAALVAGATPARTSPDADDTGERYHSSVDGRTYRVLRDAATGDKRLESDDGRRFETVADLMLAEDSALTRLERALPRDLLARALDPTVGDELVDVILRFAHQPTADAADAAEARHGTRVAALLARSREIVGLLAERRPEGQPATPRDEETLLSSGERAEHARLRSEIRELQRTIRSEVVVAARAAADADHRAVLARLDDLGASVLGTSFVLSTVSARMRLRDVVPLLDAHPEVAHVDLVRRLQPNLDVSVPVVGANTWWSAGISGSSSTLVGIVDTGVDSSHGALSGQFAAESVHLTAAAQTDSSFADSTSSTDDLYGHGTHVAGIVASTDATYSGVAPGVQLLNAKAGYLQTGGGASLQDPDIMDAGDWAATQGADVLNCSFGGPGTTDGNSSLTLFFDAVVADLGIAVAFSAGNSGSSSNTVTAPADGFNIVCVGNQDDAGTTTLSDDSINSSSSRGPCDDGRRKPDLAAPGTSINSCDAFWETSGSNWTSFTGTSMASPHVAGGMALLIDAAVAANPAGVKALLMTNARNASPFASSPDNTWGCGPLDLSAAYTNRAAVCEGSMSTSDPRYVFLRPGTLGNGKRVTLAWNRRVVSNGNSTPTTRSALLDLDLHVYEESDGSARGSSSTSLNSVEQVAVTSSSNAPVVKVRRAAASFPSGLTTQNFAVAAESSSATTVVTPPSLACTFTSLPTQIAGATNFTVSVNVANSGGLAAQAPSVTLTLPAGYSVVTGSNPQTITRIAASGNGTATWTVRSASTGSGNKTIAAAASSTSYGESFTSPTKSATQLLDVDAPTGSVVLAGNVPTSTTALMTATFSASDSGSGVAEMRFRTAGDSWGAWQAYATLVPVTLTGGDATKTFETQYRDAVGNVSATISDTIVLDSTAPSGTVTVASGAAWTTTASVTLAMSANLTTSGVADMRFSNDGVTWSSWTALAATTSYTLTAPDGPTTVFAQFRNASGTVVGAAADGIGLDRVAPPAPLTTNAWSNTPNITLTLSWAADVSGIADMRFSNDGTTWSSWATFSGTSSTPATVAWTLPNSDGAHTVYAQTRDVAGNVSTVASSPAGIDRVAPGGTLTLGGGAAWVNSTSVGVRVAGTDALSGVARMRFSDDGSTWAAWIAYADPAPDWALPGADGAKTVYVQYEDRAGNVSSTVSDGVSLDRSQPWGTISVASGAIWTSTTAVAVELTASDTTSGVADMRFIQDTGGWSAWIPFATSTTRTLIGSDGNKALFVQFRDAAGNESNAVYDGIALDTAPPQGYVVLDSGTPATNAATSNVALGWSDAGSGVAEMQFSADSGATWTPWESVAAKAGFALPDHDGSAQIRVQFRDVAGNVSKFVWDDILVDRSPPTGSLVLADGAAVLLPGQPLVAQLRVEDGAASAGINGFRWSRDGAATWSEWLDPSSGSVTLDLPADLRDRRADVLGQFRDLAGNVSEPAAASVYVLAEVLQDATLATTVRGTLGAGGDIDAYRLELQAGDRIDARVKAKAAVRGATLLVEFDLIAPDGTQVVTGRYPEHAKSPAISKFNVPATGSYVLVLRGSGTGTSRDAPYVLSTSIQAAKSAAITGSLTADQVSIPLQCAAGRVLTGTVSGVRIGDAIVEGPARRPVLVAMKRGKGTSFSLPKIVLDQGSGAYEVRLAGGSPVRWTLKLAAPKRAKSMNESLQ